MINTNLDPQAVHCLSRLLAGAADVDVEALRQAFDIPPGRDLTAIRAWLEAKPDLAQAVLATDPSTPPRVEPKTCWTVRELLNAAFPEPRWVVPDVIPEGLSLLCGRPKLGKSWLALQIACAVGTGGRVFNQTIERGRVLYLALEDSPRRIQSRMKKQSWPGEADVTFYTEWPDLAQNGGLVRLQDEIVAGGYVFVVVDTLSRAARFDQSDIGESTVVLGNLQHLAADHRCAILMVDHYRKPVGYVGDLVDDVLGSTGKAATADTILGLVRERGKAGATLRVTGRDVDERDLAIEWDVATCCWQLLGDAQEVARTEGCREVLEALEVLGGEATTKEIADYLGRNKGSIWKVLTDLVRDGRVTRGEKKDRQVRYCLARLPEDKGVSADD